eukprot:gene32565-40185_t
MSLGNCEFGEYLEDYHIQIPKLKVKRDWFEGLDPTFTDNYVRLSMFDKTGSNSRGSRDSTNPDEPSHDGSKPVPKARLDDLKAPKREETAHGRRLTEEETPETPQEPAEEGAIDAAKTTNLSFQKSKNKSQNQLHQPWYLNQKQRSLSSLQNKNKNRFKNKHNNLMSSNQLTSKKVACHFCINDFPPVDLAEGEGGEQDPADPFEVNHGEMHPDFLHGDDDYAVAMRNHNYGPVEPGAVHPADGIEPQPQEGPDHNKVPENPSDRSVPNAEDIATGKDNEQPAAADAEASPDEQPDSPGGIDGGNPEDPSIHYGYAARTARSADDGNNYYNAHRYGGMINENTAANETKYVLVDAHVLASPVLSDVNGDGHMEITFAVSYYFDKVVKMVVSTADLMVSKK